MPNSDTQTNNVQPPPFCKANVVRSCHVVNEINFQHQHIVGVFERLDMACDYAAEMTALAEKTNQQTEYRVLTMPYVVA